MFNDEKPPLTKKQLMYVKGSMLADPFAPSTQSFLRHSSRIVIAKSQKPPKQPSHSSTGYLKVQNRLLF